MGQALRRLQMTSRRTGSRDEKLASHRAKTVADADLDALFDQMRDPESVWMAAFTPADPDDRTAFDAHMARVRSSPDVTLRAVTCDGQLVGSVATFILDGETDVTYWIDRSAWGHGIASQALQLITDLVPTGPLHARAASDNLASVRVLQKSGFKIIGTEISFAPGRKKAKSRKPFCARTSATAAPRRPPARPVPAATVARPRNSP